MSALAFSLVFPRTEKATAAANDDRDLFITGQFQQTLAELDGDLEGKSYPPTLGHPTVWQRCAVCSDPTWVCRRESNSVCRKPGCAGKRAAEHSSTQGFSSGGWAVPCKACAAA